MSRRISRALLTKPAAEVIQGGATLQQVLDSLSTATVEDVERLKNAGRAIEEAAKAGRVPSEDAELANAMISLRIADLMSQKK